MGTTSTRIRPGAPNRTNTPPSASSCAASWESRTSAGNPAPSKDIRWLRRWTRSCGLHGEIFSVVREAQGPRAVGALCRRAEHRHGAGGLGGAVQGIWEQPARGTAVRSFAPDLAVHGPGAGGARIRGQDLRRAFEGYGDSLARGAAGGHPAGESCELVALPGAGLRLDGLEGLLLGAGGGRATRGP
jgi:hypothetical protein